MPTPSDSRPVTLLLQRIERGDASARDELFRVLYAELHLRARAFMRRQAPGGTLQATALVHEAYLRLAGGTGDGSARQWDGRGHFFAAAANAMRRILVERARSRGRLKRGGGRHRVELDSLIIGSDDESIDMVALDEALQRLQQKDGRKHDVVMLRFFAGLSIDQVAESLHVATATVERDWNFAKAWLFRELEDRRGDDASSANEATGANDGG